MKVPILNQAIADANNKVQVSLQMRPPDRCSGCGYVPTEEDEQAWIQIRQNSPIWFYACPKCFTLMTTKDALANLDAWAKAERQRRQRMESPLIIPKMRINNRDRGRGGMGGSGR